MIALFLTGLQIIGHGRYHRPVHAGHAFEGGVDGSTDFLLRGCAFVFRRFVGDFLGNAGGDIRNGFLFGCDDDIVVSMGHHMEEIVDDDGMRQVVAYQRRVRCILVAGNAAYVPGNPGLFQFVEERLN